MSNTRAPPWGAIPRPSPRWCSWSSALWRRRSRTASRPRRASRAAISCSAGCTRIRNSTTATITSRPADGAAAVRRMATARKTTSTGTAASRPSKFANILIREGDQVMIESAGGAGYGSPEEREAELVLRDVEEGLVSTDSARAHYRVALRRENGRVHVAEHETALLRASAGDHTH